ncbi:MAG: nuclear transport factor 2 family protein [Anaerolineae bacterium]|nr:nuclear transport factor 2 family protein [Anaerolineae bacterium]
MSPTRMSRIEAGPRAVLAFVEAFNRHDVAGMMHLMSADCVVEHWEPAPNGAVYTGKEAVTQFWQDFFRAAPRAHLKAEEVFGFGIRCVLRWRYEWVAAEGNPRHVRGVSLFKVKEGAIHQKLSYVKR